MGVAAVAPSAAATRRQVEQELDQLHQRHDGHAQEQTQVAAHVTDEGVPLQHKETMLLLYI